MEKTRFFFGKKQMNFFPDKQLFIIVSFQSNKSRKKEFRVDNKVKKTIGVEFCPIYRNEKGLTF